jgi:hypothetical protein
MVPLMWLLSTWKRRTPLLMVPNASGMVPIRLLCSNLASEAAGQEATEAETAAAAGSRMEQQRQETIQHQGRLVHQSKIEGFNFTAGYRHGRRSVLQVQPCIFCSVSTCEARILTWLVAVASKLWQAEHQACQVPATAWWWQQCC